VNAEVSHKELLERVGKHRDRAAFVTLFHYFAPRIKSYLLKNGADAHTAEEITQNTMITVWEKAESYDPAKAAPSTWIFTIARNKRIDALRREKFIASSEVPDVAAEAHEAYVDHAAADHLSEALKDLPPEQAKLVRMAFYEDKSHQTIADETSLPLGTVKSRLRLALSKLRKAVGE